MPPKGGEKKGARIGLTYCSPVPTSILSPWQYEEFQGPCADRLRDNSALAVHNFYLRLGPQLEDIPVICIRHPSKICI